MRVNSEEEMIALAQDMAKRLGPHDVILLKGPLGVGKTTFARAFIRAWMDDPELEVPSPSFALIQSYEGAGSRLHHLDLYRLSSADELIELGVDEIFGQELALVEWPERLGEWTPRDAITLNIEDAGGEAREITIEAKMKCVVNS